MKGEMHPESRRRTHFTFPEPGDYLLAAAAAILAFALYLRTLAPGLLGGDSGEFQFAAWLGGFAHPTGYPLYLMLGYVWTHLLRLNDPAWRMNAFSALWGGVAVGLIYLLALRLLRLTDPPRFSRAGQGHKPDRVHRALALFAALTFAVTPTFWSQAVIAEVYTLHAVFVVTVFLGLTIWAETHDRRVFYVTTALYGLSLTHHRSMILLVPAIAVYLWLNRRTNRQIGKSADGRWQTASRKPVLSPVEGSQIANRGQRNPQSAIRNPQSACHRPMRSIGVTLSLLILPLVLYAYIPLRAAHVPYFQVVVGPEQTLQLYTPTVLGFIEHVTGQVFGSVIGSPSTAASHFMPATRWWVREVSWAGVALGLLGLIRLARRSRPLLALTGLSLLAIVVFNLFYGIGDIFVFYIPAYLIWVLWMALGAAALGERMGKWANGRWQIANRKPVLSPVEGSQIANHGQRNPQSSCHRPMRSIGVTLSLCLLAFALPIYLLLAHYSSIDQSRNDRARAMWRTILAGPIPENAILISNDRDEMTPLFYLQYVEGRRPDLTGLFPRIQPAPEWADVGRVTDAALRSGRPGLLIKPMPGLEVKFRLEPAAALMRVLGPAAEKPPEHPQNVVYAETIRLIGYDLGPAGLSPGRQVAVTLYWQPMRQLDADYTTFVHLVNADGAKIAQSDHRPGGVYYPTSLWRPDEVLSDVHNLALAADLGRPPYTIVVGLYAGNGDLRHLGEPQQIGVIGP